MQYIGLGIIPRYQHSQSKIWRQFLNQLVCVTKYPNIDNDSKNSDEIVEWLLHMFKVTLYNDMMKN